MADLKNSMTLQQKHKLDKYDDPYWDPPENVFIG